MVLTNDVIAVSAGALVAPAVVFVTALTVRQIRPLPSAPVRTADRVVLWYAAHPQLGLWGLLLLLPLAAFVLGSGALLRTWRENAELQALTWRALSAIPNHWPAVAIGIATMLAGGVLAMITAHLMREA